LTPTIVASIIFFAWKVYLAVVAWGEFYRCCFLTCALRPVIVRPLSPLTGGPPSTFCGGRYPVKTGAWVNVAERLFFKMNYWIFGKNGLLLLFAAHTKTPSVTLPLVFRVKVAVAFASLVVAWREFYGS